MMQGQQPRCLHCGKPLSEKPFVDEWHIACMKMFFGSSTFPLIELDQEHIEEYAASHTQEGIDITGVQPKLSLRLEKDDITGQKRLTFIGLPAGYILKPQTSTYPQLPENEHLTMLLAALCGISTVPHSLLRLQSGELAYITKRIDRKKVEKIPMEDFCQLSELPTELKYRSSYEQCGKIIRRFATTKGLDLQEFFNRVVFSFITGNADMHLKNFSLYKPMNWNLAPAYDLVSTKLVIPEDSEELALTVRGKKSKLTRNDFLSLAENLALPKESAIRVMDFYKGKEPDMLSEIQVSFLAESLKESYCSLVTERISRLQE